MKRWIFWTFALLAAVLLGGGALALLTSGMRVRASMTEADVERVLGAKGLECEFFVPNEYAVTVLKARRRKVWLADAGAFLVDFDASGRVVCVEQVDEQMGVWARLRAWLGLAP